jgi:predicted nucleic acid-binding protein
MKRKIKVYLDTSVISAYFDKKNPERQLLTDLFFKRVEMFDAYVSEVVLA